MLNKLLIAFLLLPLLLLFSLAIKVDRALALGSPVKISASGNQTVFPQITSDQKGYMHMVWMEVATATETWGGHANPGIMYSRWNGDVWSTPINISSNTGFAEIPSIASDSNNTAYVVWDDETLGSGVAKVGYKTRDVAGNWSAIETLPTPNGTTANWNARVAVGTSNIPNVVFSGNTNGNQDSIYWTQKVSGAWTTPQIVSTDVLGNTIKDCQWADLKQDTSNNVYLTYWCFSEGIFYRTYTGSWSTPVQITSATDIQYVRLATTPGGQAFISWYQSSDSSVRVRWTRSGVWQTETSLTTLGAFSFWGFPIMGVTTDSRENAYVGWGQTNSSTGLIDLLYKSYNPTSNSWGSANNVNLNNQDADSPVVFPDKWDNQHFSWSQKNSSTGQWEIYYRAQEGTVSSITSSGGTVTANPFGTTLATLSIPNGAFPTTQQIGIQIGPVPEDVNQTQVTIPRSFTFRPSGLTFAKTVTATLTYTAAEAVGVDPRLFKPWVWDSSTNTWVAQTGTISTQQQTIKLSLSHFSLYGISAPIVKINFTKDLTSGPITQGAKHFEFEAKYADGKDIMSPETPDDLVVLLKNTSGDVVQEIKYKPAGLTKTPGKNTYQGTLLFDKNNIPNGDYNLEVYLANSLVKSIKVTLNI